MVDTVTFIGSVVFLVQDAHNTFSLFLSALSFSFMKFIIDLSGELYLRADPTVS